MLISDQRGLTRFSGAAVDLGAFESQSISLSPETLANGNVEIAYIQPITANQPDSQAWWAPLFAGQVLWDQIFFSVVAGNLPAGLNLSSDGVLSGTPTESGTFTFTVGASNLPGTGSRQYTLNIAPKPQPVVDTLDDNFDVDYSAGRTSLREAIDLVHRGLATGPVSFAPGLTGTISLGLGPLSVVGNVIIQGPGAGSLTIDAAGRSRVFEIQGPLGTETRISGLTVTGGSADFGGGILNYAAKLSLGDLVVNGNTGGGICSSMADLSIVDSTISDNVGVGIQVFHGSTILVGSTVAHNAGGASGGGVSVLSGGVAMIINTTIAGNSASRGGGLYVQGGVSGPFAGMLTDVTLRNVTLAGNTASQGAGAYLDTSTGLFLGNTIIADNNGPQVSIADFQAGVIVEGPTLIEGGLAGYPEVLSTDPMLGPLQDNGGSTKTMALLGGSPAVDAGDVGLIPDGTLVDQRGGGFARIAGGSVDLGAFEAQNEPPTITRILDAVVVDEASLAVNAGHYSDAQGIGTVTLSASLGIVNGDIFTGIWVWTYTPPDGPSGPTTVTITATDDAGMHAVTTFDLTVNNVSPTITDFSVPVGAQPDSTVNLNAAATDPAAAHDPLTFTWTLTNPDGATQTIIGASVSFVPDIQGTWDVSLSVSDGDGGTDLRSASIHVGNAPTNIRLSRVNLPENRAPGYEIGTLKTTDADPNDGFIYTLVDGVGGGDNGFFEVAGDRLRSATTFDYETRSSYSIRVRSTDASGLWTEKAFNINVTNVNERPTILMPEAQVVYEDVEKAIHGISVGDVDSAALTVTLSVSHGKLALATTSGLTVEGVGTGLVTLNGSAADLNAALASLNYLPGLNYGGNDRLKVTTGDGRLSLTQGVAIAVKSAGRQAKDLTAQVNALRTAGVLSKAQASVLNSLLKLSGSESDIGKVTVFLFHVNLYSSADILSPEQAQALFDPASILLLSVTRR